MQFPYFEQRDSEQLGKYGDAVLDCDSEQHPNVSLGFKLLSIPTLGE